MKLSEQRLTRDFEWEVNSCIMLLREDPVTFWSFEKCFDGDETLDDFLEAWR